MSEISQVAVLQSAMGEDPARNTRQIEKLVREAARAGARIILPPELFASPYFPRRELPAFFERAQTADACTELRHMAALARELEVVIPVSFFEREGPSYYNSVAVLDASGQSLGIYRKSHIPDGPGYQEKFYFRPGTTGFRCFHTRYGAIGVGICWDQWFPEAARAMVLSGADLLLYPTAIGSEPEEPELDTRGPWRKAMQGHAVCNGVPVAAANRVGNEGGQVFYGSSFVCDQWGELKAELGREDQGFALASLDLAQVRRDRASMGFFRDRRPDLYRSLVEA